jgi:hypothetical protein
MNIAKKLADAMKDKGIKRTRKSIYTVASDEHSLHCMTEDMIDVWWASLSPDEKAIHFEADLNGELYEAVALAAPSPETPAFEKHVDQFFADMKRLRCSPFAGLMPANSLPTREVQEAQGV